MYAEALIELEGLRDIKGVRRGNLLRFTRDATFRRINDGVRNEKDLLRLVQHDVELRYGSVILTAIIIAVVGFIVRRILERLFPKDVT